MGRPRAPVEEHRSKRTGRSAPVEAHRSKRTGRSAPVGEPALVGIDELSCNMFHLSAEPDYGIDGVLADHWGNHCSCGGQEQDCAVVSVGLSPPDPIE